MGYLDKKDGSGARVKGGPDIGPTAPDPHGGNVYGVRPVRLDFSVNTNPLGMPDAVRRAVASHPEDWSRYPDIQCRELRESLACLYRRNGCDFLDAEHFICGNGAADLLYSLIFALRPRKALLPVPCFGEYESALRAGGCETVRTVMSREDGFFLSLPRLFKDSGKWEGVDWLIIGNPNNPTGASLPLEELEELAVFCERRGIFLVVDECFQWFLEEPERYSSLRLLEKHRGLFLLNAFTKVFAMAGLRLGYGICRDRPVMERIAAVRQPWSVSGPAQRAGTAALGESDFLARTRSFVSGERSFLEKRLSGLGLEVFPSTVNYLLFRGPGGADLSEFCLKRGILIRSCANFSGLNTDYYRVAVKRREENEELLACLAEALGRGTGQTQE